MKNNNKIVLISIISLIILTIVITISINSFSSKNKIIGSWTIDNITIYEFNQNNTGKMKVSLNEYEFTYKIDNDKLMIAFKDEKLSDYKYTFTIQKEKLILKGENGEFTFTKIK